MSDRVWATLLTREDYLPGVRVLWRSLREAGTAYPLVVMVTAEVPEPTRELLRADGCEVVLVGRLDPPESVDYVFGHFSEVWNKLRAWELPYARVGLLDADLLVTRCIDDLMSMPLPDGGIAAAQTCRCNPEGHPDYPADWVPEQCFFSHQGRDLPADYTPYFNSGVVVLEPSPVVLDALVARLVAGDPGRYAFPDQDLLNEHFRHRWAPLPVGCNALKTLAVQHPEVWDGDPDAAHVRVIHYLLAKPWATDGEPTNPAYAALDRRWHEVEARVRSSRDPQP